MIRRLLGRVAAEGAGSGTPAGSSESGQPAAGTAAAGTNAAAELDPEAILEAAAAGSLNAVAGTAVAARRELRQAIGAAAEVRAVLDRLSRFNGGTDVEFVAYLDGRLADVRDRVSRLAGGLSDEASSLGTVAGTLLEINERHIDADEARLNSVRALTGPFRTAGPDSGAAETAERDGAGRVAGTEPGGESGSALGQEGQSQRRAVGRLGRGLRTVALAMALLLAATLVDASSPTRAVQHPTEGAEFASLPGDDSLQLPPLEPAATAEASLGPTNEPAELPSLDPTAEPTAVVVAPSPEVVEPTIAPAAPPTVPAVPTTARVTYRVTTDRPVVALTFDDGWSGKNGRLILDILVRERVPATFFLNGTYLSGNLQLWRDVADAGFTVGNHTWRHTDVTKLSTDQIVADLQQNAAAFEAATGHQMAPLFRPPYGFHTATSDAAAALAGFPDIVLWDTTDNDTRRFSDAQMIATGAAGKAGSIVLLHVGPDVTPRILEDLLHSYWARGFGFVPLLDLLYPAGYPVTPVPTDVPTAVPTEPSPPAPAAPSPSPTNRTPLLSAR